MAEPRTATANKGFTTDEKAAMKSRAKELKGADGESERLAKVAEMPPADRAMAERIHELVKAAAPDLTSRTYYGMPAYAKDGNVVLWFKPGSKFKTRYSTLEFSDKANIDDGDMFPVYFAVKKLTPATEARITALVKQAVS